MLCLKNKPSEDYEHFALLLLFQLLFEERLLLPRTVLICKIPHCTRTILTLSFQSRIYFKQGRDCSVLPIGAYVQEMGYEHVVRH